MGDFKSNNKESPVDHGSERARSRDIGDVKKGMANQIESETESQKEGQSGTSFWSVAHSIGAGLLGVQSRKNRERDFTHGKPIHFVIGGVVGTLLFLLVIWLLVQYLLATS